MLGTAPLRMPLDAGDVNAPTLLFVLLGPPLAWSLHFGTLFVLVMVFCRAGQAGVDAWLYMSAVPFAGVSVSAAVVGWRKWRRLRARGSAAVDASQPDGPALLLLAIGVLGAVVFSLVIALESLAPFYLAACAETR